MELVYLWVEDNKNIHNQGFNFSPRFTCKYDKDTQELTVDENKDILENFFGKNINITAIVGENGSGKSALFEGLLSRFGLKITITYCNGIFTIHKSHEFKIINKTIMPHETNKGSLRSGNSSLINFSWDIFKYEPIVDIASYLYADTNILITLFNTFSEPEYLNLNSYKRLFILKLLDVYIKYQPDNFEYIPKKIEIKLQVAQNDNKLDFKTINSEIDKLHFLPKEEAERKKEDGKKAIKKYIKEYSDSLKSGKNFTLTEFKILLEKNEIISELLGKLNYFTLEVYDETNVNLSDLSHGERSILLSNLLIYESIMQNKDENILFLLDEPDITLHPQWQKTYISQLIHTFENIGKKIHFLITSHSPFILSDIPKENVIFLKDGKQEDVEINPFGANIHTLLSHGFFMQDGLMGEFAKSKIEDVINYLNDKESTIKNNDEAQKFLNIIGEPVIKNQLQKMLDSKRLSKIDEIDIIKNQIKELQDKLKKVIK